MHYLQFLEKLERRDIPPVCLFYGEEDFLKEEALSRLEEILFPEKDSAAKEVFEDKIIPARLNESLSYTPILAGHKLTVIKQFQALDKEAGEVLKRYLVHPGEESYLVIFMDKAEIAEKWASLSAKIAEVKFAKLYENDILTWLILRARSFHKSMSREVAGLFLEHLGPDLGLLSQGLNRVIDYVGNKEAIETEEVEEILASEKKEALFDLTASFASQDKAGSLKILSKLFLEMTSPQEIISGLAWQVRRLYILKKGGTLNIPPFFLKKLKGEADKFSGERLEECLAQLREVDREIKRGEKNPRLALELFFFRFLS